MRRLLVGACLLIACSAPPDTAPQGDPTPAAAERWLAPTPSEIAPPADAPQAPPVTLADGLQLAEAERLCLWLNPALRALRLEAAVPRARARFADLRDDPELGLEAMRVLGDVDDPWILGASLEFSLPASRLLRARREAAEARADRATLAARAGEWRALRALRALWFEHAHARLELARLERFGRELEPLLAQLRKLKDGGALGEAELAVVELAVGERQLELETLRAAQAGRRLALLAQLGLSARAEVRLDSALPATRPAPPAPDRELYARIAARHPEVQAALAGMRLADEAQRLALREALPAIAGGPAFELEEGDPRVGLALGSTLPIWNRNAAERAGAAAEQQAARAATIASYQDAVVSYHRGLLRLEAHRRRARELSGLRAIAARLLRDARRRAQLGEADALLLKEAATKQLELDRAELALRLQQAQTEAELASLTEEIAR